MVEEIQQEALDRSAPQSPARWVEGGEDGIGGNLLQLAGDDGREQDAAPIDSFRPNENAVLLGSLNNVDPASALDRTGHRPTLHASFEAELPIAATFEA